MIRYVLSFGWALALALATPVFADGENLFQQGNAADGEMPFTVKEESGLRASIFQGDPSGGEEKACFEIVLLKDFPQEGPAVNFSFPQVPIDGEQVYRLSFRVWSSDDVTVVVGGYSFGENRGVPLQATAGKGVWQYSLRPEDMGSFKPSERGTWVNFETTVGPEGSTAQNQWPPDACFLSFTVWLKGPENAKVYLNDFRMEPVAAEKK